MENNNFFVISVCLNWVLNRIPFVRCEYTLERKPVAHCVSFLAKQEFLNVILNIKNIRPKFSPIWVILQLEPISQKC